MIDRLLVFLVQSRLDRGRPPGPRLRRWLAARPDAQRQADALLDADRRLRDAGLAMRGEANASSTDRPIEPPVIARLGGRPAYLSAAALIAVAASLITAYALFRGDPDGIDTIDTPVVVAPERPGARDTQAVSPEGPITDAPTTITLRENLTTFTAMTDRVASTLGGLDTLDASVVRTATGAIAAPYRSEADGLAAAFSSLLPAVRLPAEAASDGSSG